MGKISNPVNLDRLIRNFNISNFVETGVGDGTSMQEVFNLNLVKNFYGIELDKNMCIKLENSELGNHVVLYNGYSKDEIFPLLKALNDKPTLFWLDAHFPDSDYNGAPYDSEPDATKRIPLNVELEAICSERNILNDVIIIDDLRVYIDGPFESGSWPFRVIAGADGYQFAKDLLSKTHIIIENYKDQGYILAFPINTNEYIINSIVIN